MSGETVLRIQPGESLEDFTRRIVDTAPDAPPHVMDRIRTLLVPSTPAADPAPSARTALTAA
ncbi:hypothetical protein ACWCQN_12805 [Streptomyces sp. NPDC001984]